MHANRGLPARHPVALGLIAPGYRPHSRFPHGGAPPYTDPKYDRTDPIAEYHRFNRMADEAARNYGSPDHAELTQAMMMKTAEIVRRHPQSKDAVRQAITGFETENGLERHHGAREETEGASDAPAANHAQLDDAAETRAETERGTAFDHEPVFPASVQSPAVKDVFPTDPNGLRPVPLMDDMGQAVLDYHGKIMRRPAGMDPHYFVSKGLQDTRIETSLLFEYGFDAQYGFAVRELSNFRRSGPWDAQRLGGSKHPEFIDYSTVAIGLYAAANGISRDDILAIENAFSIFSSFGNVDMDETYTFLPKRNVFNTDLGYSLYSSGRVASKLEP